MPSIDTKPHIEAKRSIMWGFIVVIPANRRVIFKEKSTCFQTRLLCLPNKALLHCKEALFGVQTRLLYEHDVPAVLIMLNIIGNWAMLINEKACLNAQFFFNFAGDLRTDDKLAFISLHLKYFADKKVEYF